MILTYLGKQFFKIQQGDTVVAVNPISKESKWDGKVSKFGSELVLITTRHPDFNGVDTVTYGEAAPFVISGAGEYEVKGIGIRGAESVTTIGGKEFMNTAYSLSLEGITVATLGAISPETKVSDLSIDSPDILLLPIGAGMDPAKAYKMAVSLEPHIIIPMDYDEKELKAFLKEAGQNPEPLEKLTIKRKEVEAKESEIVVLSF